MTTMEFAKLAFERRHPAKEWFQDALPCFELFERLVREDERAKIQQEHKSNAKTLAADGLAVAFVRLGGGAA